MTAASEGHISIVRLFLQHNANTELKDSQGWKASDHAVIHGHHRLGKHAFLIQGYLFKVKVIAKKKLYLRQCSWLRSLPRYSI